MKINKARITEAILETGIRQPCIKLELQNIIFPKWDDLGLIGKMFRQCVSTKEQPYGNIYDENVFQTVLRIIGGKVLIEDKPDCYCWKFGKIEAAKEIRKIGSNSADGILALCELLNTINSTEEKKLLADMFSHMKKDLLLVTTPEEKRTCIEINARNTFTYCVDQWMETDSEGYAEATQLQFGDYLIVSDSGVYRVGHDEFRATHKLM